MNELVRGVIRLGRDQLPVVVALQSLKAAPAPKLSLIQVNDWVKGNVDDFRDRVDEAHSVFKGRMTAQLIMHADNPVLPKGLQRDTLALLAVNNAENPERYKRGVFVPPEPPGKGVAGKLAEVGKNAADERAERKVLSNGHKGGEGLKPLEEMGTLATVVIDPPWEMVKIERDVRPNQHGFDYPTLRYEEIGALNLPLAADALVFCGLTDSPIGGNIP